MKVLMTSFFALGLLLMVAPSQSQSKPGPKVAKKQVKYADVQAVFDRNCVRCHGDNGKDGINLKRYDRVMAGGKHGAIIIPKKPAESVLFKAITGAPGVEKMPRKAPPLSKADIALIEAWIKAGAKSR